MLEGNEDSWFGRLEDNFPKVKRMRRVYPRVDYTQATWTIVLRQPSQNHPHFKGGIRVSSVILHSARLFVESVPHVGDTTEVESDSAATIIVQSLIPPNCLPYTVYTYWCTRHAVLKASALCLRCVAVFTC